MRTPSLRKHSSGQARVTLNGRDFLLGAWGSKESRQAYHRLIAEWEASGRSSTFGCEPESIAIVEVVAMYLKFCRKYYGDGRTTEINTIIPAMKALRSLYGETTAVKFGPLQFKALRAFLMKPVKRKLKSGKIKESVRSRTYINALMKRVRRLFKWASSESILPGSIYTNLSCVEPLKRGRTTAPERERVEPVEEMVVAKTIEHLSPTVAAMVRFQQLTGCRPGEVCSIKSGMVDRSKDVWEICMNKHKNAWRGKARTIYVGPEAQKVLAPFLLRDANSYCFSPREAEEKRREQASENRT
ncbi:MAG: site-specific integrase, partial [Pirellula sp.]